MKTGEMTLVGEQDPSVPLNMIVREELNHEFDNLTRLLQLNKESTNQIGPNSYEEIHHNQDGEKDFLELEVHAMGDNSDNGSSSREENGGFEDINPNKYRRLKSSF